MNYRRIPGKLTEDGRFKPDNLPHDATPPHLDDLEAAGYFLGKDGLYEPISNPLHTLGALAVFGAVAWFAWSKWGKND